MIIFKSFSTLLKGGPTLDDPNKQRNKWLLIGLIVGFILAVFGYSILQYLYETGYFLK